MSVFIVIVTVGIMNMVSVGYFNKKDKAQLFVRLLLVFSLLLMRCFVRSRDYNYMLNSRF